jgi:outer membrane protein OmpA-like peptidoglycan-associated protein
MCEAKKERRQVFRGTSLAASSVLLSTVLLAGCSSVGDSLNPVGWYKGVSDWASGTSSSTKEAPADTGGFPVIPNDKRPDVSSNKERSDLSKGLTADHSNARYTQDVLRRDGNPTRPLSADMALAPKEVVAPASTTSSASSSLTSSSTASSSPAAAAPSAVAPVVQPQPAVTTDSITAPVVAAKPEQSRPDVSAQDASVVPPKPAVAVDDSVPPPPPPRLPVSAAASAPSAQMPDVVPPPNSSTSGASMPAESTVSSASSAAPVSAPVPAPALAPAPAPAAAPVKVAAASPPPAMTAPAPAPATSVEAVYRQRLAEFNAGTVSAAAAPVVKPVAKPASVPVAVANDVDSGTLLIPPSEYRHKLSHDNGGARALEDFDASRSAASFQVATVGFGEGTAALSDGELQHLKDVAALYREKGGVIRIFGRSASPRLEVDARTNQTANRQLAGARAAAIARELIKLGVSSRKIFAGAAPATATVSASATNGETTEIYIDY